MYSMLKKIITEKDIRRQILLLEQLLNHSQLTSKELAEKIDTTERTIFSDLQLIRSYLPEHWVLASDKSGIRLSSQKNSLTNDIWESFFAPFGQFAADQKIIFYKGIEHSAFS